MVIIQEKTHLKRLMSKQLLGGQKLWLTSDQKFGRLYQMTLKSSHYQNLPKKIECGNQLNVRAEYAKRMFEISVL